MVSTLLSSNLKDRVFPSLLIISKRDIYSVLYKLLASRYFVDSASVPPFDMRIIVQICYSYGFSLNLKIYKRS